MKTYLQNSLSEFYDYISNKQFDKAKDICSDVIAASKQILATRLNNTVEENNFRYVIGIMFKGFAEFIELKNLTIDNNWQTDFDKVESVWYILCDCIDYLNYSACLIETAPLTDVMDEVESFSRSFTQIFGKGIYASPVLIFGKESCSICAQDLRICEHRVGKLYNGLICRSIPDELLEFRRVDLVQVPKDPRCRVWPWKAKENGIYEVRILNASTSDDFLYDQ